eukprot:scaffold106512_cov17-Tisochrysis_lutea.AAC.1
MALELIDQYPDEPEVHKVCGVLKAKAGEMKRYNVVGHDFRHTAKSMCFIKISVWLAISLSGCAIWDRGIAKPLSDCAILDRGVAKSLCDCAISNKGVANPLSECAILDR